MVLLPFALAFVLREMRLRHRVSGGVRPASSQPSVVLISIDTLRADCLGAYGGQKGITPNLDRLARAGVVCETAIAQSSWTLPSVASLLTGLHPSRHGAGPSLNGFDLLARAPLQQGTWTLPQALQAAGYQRHAVVSNPYLAVHYGLAAGFDTYENLSIESEVLVALGPTFAGRLLAPFFRNLLSDSAAVVTHRALRRLDQLLPAANTRAEMQPFFLWVHYIDPHAPYGCGGDKSFRGDTLLSSFNHGKPDLGQRFEPIARLRAGEIHLTRAEKEQLITLYDAGVADVDRHIGLLLDRLLLEGGDVRNDVVVVLTSDHGEEFWDHGGVEHGHSFYDELVRVPLIFAGGGLPRGARLGGLARLTDVTPTLLDLVGERAPADLDGSTLLSRTDGQVRLHAEGRVAVCQSLLFAEEKVAARTDRYKYVRWQNGKEELYDLQSDPYELRDLGSSGPLDWARTLVGESVTADWQTRNSDRNVDTASIRTAMERLGYL